MRPEHTCPLCYDADPTVVVAFFSCRELIEHIDAAHPRGDLR